MLSGSNAISLRETVAGCFDPPVCQELPDNWEDSYFLQVGQEQTTIEHGDGNGHSDGLVESAEYCTRSGKCGVQSIVQEVENADDVIVI